MDVVDDGSGPHVAERYLYGPAVDQIFAQEDVTGYSSAGATLWMIDDNLGTVRDVVDNSKHIINHIDYDAFGVIQSITDRSTSTPVATTLRTRFTFTAQEFDPDTGLMWYGDEDDGRWYDPVVQRFLSRDPAKDGTNWYIYVGNAPTIYVDPSGLWKWKGGTRQGGSRAIMIPEAGDTTQTAAEFTKLEPSESEKWLRDSTGHWVKPGEKIDYCQKYNVPNTVVVGVGKAGLATSIIAVWQNRVTNALEKRGFQVETYRADLGTKANTVENAARGKDVWGLALFGHGLITWNSWYDPRIDHEADDTNGGLKWDTVEEIVLPRVIRGDHKLGLVIAYFCYADMQPWSSLVSTLGKYYGAVGSLSALSGPRGVGYWGSWDGLVGSAAD